MREIAQIKFNHFKAVAFLILRSVIGPIICAEVFLIAWCSDLCNMLRSSTAIGVLHDCWWLRVILKFDMVLPLRGILFDWLS